jgi:hypothetical protein
MTTRQIVSRSYQWPVLISRVAYFDQHPRPRQSRDADPLNDKLFVQPVTAIVAPPNLSVHKPAGNCAPRDDDRA